MSANASDVSDDIDAALRARAAQGQPDSGTDDIDAALRARAKQAPGSAAPERVGLAKESILGPLELAGTGIANIPHGIAHAGVDLYRSIFSPSDVGKPDPSLLDAIKVSPGPAGNQLASDIAGIIPNRNAAAGAQPDDTNVPQFGDTSENIIGHTVRVGGDVGALTPAAALVKPVVAGARGVAESFAKKAPLTPQASLDAAVAKSPTSMGASAASPNITQASMPLQSEISTAVKTGAFNRSAMDNQLKADEFGIQLTKGQATGDQAQLADEFNKRNEHPEFAQRKVETNQKLINGINDIKQDVAPKMLQ